MRSSNKVVPKAKGIPHRFFLQNPHRAIKRREVQEIATDREDRLLALKYPAIPPIKIKIA